MRPRVAAGSHFARYHESFLRASYTKRKSIASKYISALRERDAAGFCSFTLAKSPPGGLDQFLEPGALKHFDQGVAMRLQDPAGHIRGQLAEIGAPTLGGLRPFYIWVGEVLAEPLTVFERRVMRLCSRLYNRAHGKKRHRS